MSDWQGRQQETISEVWRFVQRLPDVDMYVESAPGYRCAPLGRLMPYEWKVGGLWGDERITADAMLGLEIMALVFDARRSLSREVGAPWLELFVSEEGVGWVDFDMRPDVDDVVWRVLDPVNLVAELDLVPRESVLVPAWMKVELAVAGLWDVDRDVASWDSNFESLVPGVSREVAEAAFSGQPLVSEVLFGAGGPPAGLSRSNPLVVSR